MHHLRLIMLAIWLCYSYVTGRAGHMLCVSQLVPVPTRPCVRFVTDFYVQLCRLSVIALLCDGATRLAVSPGHIGTGEMSVQHTVWQVQSVLLQRPNRRRQQPRINPVHLHPARRSNYLRAVSARRATSVLASLVRRPRCRHRSGERRQLALQRPTMAVD